MKPKFEKLNEIVELKGTKNKIELLSELLSHSPTKEFLDILFNDDVYDIAEISIDKIIKTPQSLFKENKSFKTQIDFMKNLSGNNKIDSLSDFFSNIGFSERLWYKRALLKNFPTIGKSSYNKSLKLAGFKPNELFELQLCKSIILDVNGEVLDWNGLKTDCKNYVQTKLDGARTYIIKSGETIEFISRNGLQFYSLGLLKQELLNMFPNKNFIFDGEIIAKNGDFKTLMTKLRRKKQMTYEDFEYGIFDVISFNDEDYKQVIQKKRYDWLLKHIKQNEIIKVVETNITTNNLSIIELFNKKVSNGEEGIVIKPENSIYKYGSRDNWWKMKPVYEGTFEIYDIKYGTGKNIGKISALFIKDKYNTIHCKVGSGFTEKDVEFCTNKGKEYLVGKFVDIYYNEILDNGLRFPRLKKPNSENESNLRLRFDKKESDDLIPLKIKFEEIKYKKTKNKFTNLHNNFINKSNKW